LKNLAIRTRDYDDISDVLQTSQKHETFWFKHSMSKCSISMPKGKYCRSSEELTRSLKTSLIILLGSLFRIRYAAISCYHRKYID